MSKRFNTGIVWFRRDLRLTDNPALHEAVSACKHVVPLWLDSLDGDWAPGAASRWWLHHSLEALAADMSACGASLVLRDGDALEQLRAIIADTGADAVFWNRLYEPAAIKRDTAIKQSLREAGTAVSSHNAALLSEPWQIMTKSNTPYKVFTAYWRTAQSGLQLREALPAPAKIPAPKSQLASLPLSHFDLLPSVDWAAGIRSRWQPGEQAALGKINRFSKAAVRDYDETRDFPAVDGVSRLSPHLHFGEVSPHQIWQAVRQQHDIDDEGSRVFLSEIGWREFAHYVLYHFPHTSDDVMYQKYADFPWREDAADLIRAWERGATGVPIVDAGMRQLWHTGWMHNRVRMIVASFLVKNIRAHWLHGARWFWDTLIDADLPANSMGWQWSAGSGAAAAPYFRIFNPQRQGERVDKDGDYVRRWVPEIAALPNRFIHQPWAAPDKVARAADFTPGKDYPLPIVDLAESRDAALAAFKSLKEAAS